MTTDLPLVSVVMPAFNAEAFVAETLRSVLAQDYPNVETIVVDDGSTDGTHEAAKAFASDRVVVLSQPNRGGSAARNRGLAEASGAFIQFLDADDILSPDKIGAQVKALESHPNVVAACQTVGFRDGEDPTQAPVGTPGLHLADTGDPVGFLSQLWGADGLSDVVGVHAWLTPSALVRDVGPWDETILLDQDGEFFARVLLRSAGVRATEGRAYYRKFDRAGSVSSGARRRAASQSRLDSAQKKVGYLIEREDSERTRRAAATQYILVAIDAFPTFPDIVEAAERLAEEQGQPPTLPVLGGTTIEWVKRRYGWKAARRLRGVLHRPPIGWLVSLRRRMRGTD